MIPEGMRDLLPAEVAALRGLGDIVRGRFAAYGYGEVSTPVLEFAATFEQADDDTLLAGYRVFDEQGQALMLRTDMTVPVARLAAARYRDRPLPMRLCYVEDSFRLQAASRGLDGEFTQAGAELIGVASAAADAECVTLLCDCLRATGLPRFRVAVGTVAFHGALVEALGLPDDQEDALMEALAERDYPLLESILNNAGADDDAVQALQRALQLGGGQEALAQARRLVGSAGRATVDRLEKVRELVEQAGFEDLVDIDFGLYPEFAYYTGLLVEAYAPGVGLPIAAGGRYDELLAGFDRPAPAVGFAISLDRLTLALEEAGAAPRPPARPLTFAGGFDEPELCAELRAAGVPVMAVPDDERPLRTPSLCREQGDWVLEAADGSVTRGSLRDVRRALGVG
ncbi:MAG: ATP phosphoribosyltransferase regulatory subunit [Actinobacteria bacterium]|nr:ATP phosphoribosyltransferase regulatory subunit [Actinomycetota bacterium]